MRLIGAVLVVVCIVAGVAACAADAPSALTFRGVVTSVEGTGPVTVDRFTVRADDGRTLTFSAERLDATTGKPPGHLREHMTSGEAVAVEYVVEDGRNIALSYED